MALFIPLIDLCSLKNVASSYILMYIACFLKHLLCMERNFNFQSTKKNIKNTNEQY